MAVLFFSGWETGDNQEWSALGSGSTIQSAAARSGQWGLKDPDVADVDSSLTTKTGFNKSTIFARAAFYVDVVSRPTTDLNARIVTFRTAAGGNIGSIRLFCPVAALNGDVATLRLYNDTTTLQVGSDFNIQNKKWYVLELKLVVSLTLGVLEMRVDGVVQAGGTALSTGATNADQLAIGHERVAGAGGTVDLYFDDAQANDAAYPGVGRVVRKAGIDEAAPTYDEWTKSGGASISNGWSEVPPGATRFSISPGTGDPLRQTMPAIKGSFGIEEDNGLEFSSGKFVQGGTGGSGETNQAQAQSITPRENFSLKYWDAVLLKTGSPSDNLTASLYSDSGGSPGSLVAASNTLAASGVTTTPTWRRFTFATAQALIAGTKYWLVFERSGARDASNYCWLYAGSTTTGYPRGEGKTRDNNAWGSAAIDLLFRALSDGGPQAIKSGDTINAAKICGVALRSSGSGRTHEFMKRLSGADAFSGDLGLTTSDAFYSWDIGAPTLAQLDACEIGARKSGGAGGRSMTVEDIYLMVDFTPAAAGGFQDSAAHARGAGRIATAPKSLLAARALATGAGRELGRPAVSHPSAALLAGRGGIVAVGERVKSSAGEAGGAGAAVTEPSLLASARSASLGRGQEASRPVLDGNAKAAAVARGAEAGQPRPLRSSSSATAGRADARAAAAALRNSAGAAAGRGQELGRPSADLAARAESSGAGRLSAAAALGADARAVAAAAGRVLAAASALWSSAAAASGEGREEAAASSAAVAAASAEASGRGASAARPALDANAAAAARGVGFEVSKAALSAESSAEASARGLAASEPALEASSAAHADGGAAAAARPAVDLAAAAHAGGRGSSVARAAAHFIGRALAAAAGLARALAVVIPGAPAEVTDPPPHRIFTASEGGREFQTPSDRREF